MSIVTRTPVATERELGRREARALLRVDDLKEWWQEHDSIARYNTATGGGSGTVQANGFVRLTDPGGGRYHDLYTPPLIDSAYGTYGHGYYIRTQARIPSGTIAGMAAVRLQQVGAVVRILSIGAYDASLGGHASKFMVAGYDGATDTNLITSTIAVDDAWHTWTLYNDTERIGARIDKEPWQWSALTGFGDQPTDIGMVVYTAGVVSYSVDFRYLQCLYERA